MKLSDCSIHRDYSIHNIIVRVGWDDPRVGERIQTILDYFAVVPLDTAPRTPQINLAFATKPGPPTGLNNAREIAQHYGITAWEGDAQIYLSDGHATVELDPSSGAGRGTIHSVPWNNRCTFRKDLLLYSLLFLLRYSELYAVHAACVAKDGLGCLFVADSDSGKSTMTLSLVREGWKYVADDSILLRTQGDDVQALPLRRDLCLDTKTAEYFPEVMAHLESRRLANGLKQRINMGALYPQQVVETSMPRLLVFPKLVSLPASELIPVGKARALLNLIRQSALVALQPDLAPTHLNVLKCLVNQTRSYELLAGQDLERDPTLIAHLLAQIWQPDECSEGSMVR